MGGGGDGGGVGERVCSGVFSGGGDDFSSGDVVVRWCGWKLVVVMVVFSDGSGEIEVSCSSSSEVVSNGALVTVVVGNGNCDNSSDGSIVVA